MKVLTTCDDTGAAKLCSFKRGTDTSKKDATQPDLIENCMNLPKSNYKTRIIHLINYNYQYFIASRLGGTLSIYDYEENDVAMKPQEKQEGNGSKFDKEQKSSLKVESESTNSKENIEEVAGYVEERFKFLHEFKLPVSMNDRPIALQKCEKLDSVLVAYESGKVYLVYVGDFSFEPLLLHLPGCTHLNAFAIHPEQENVVAFGGKETDLQIAELYNSSVNSKIFKKDYKSAFVPKILFKAKNVSNDHLNLRVPIWITNILFFTNNVTNGQYKLITSTRYGQLRIYDTKHGRKPVKDYPVSTTPILTLLFGNDKETEVVLTDTQNLMAKYSLDIIDDKAFKTNSASAGDIIKPVPKLLGKYTGGNTGATLAQQVYEGIVAFAGLDRYLRVFDVESRQILAKVYLGVEVSSLIIIDDEDEENEEEQKRKRDEEEEDNEMWSQLDKKQKV